MLWLKALTYQLSKIGFFNQLEESSNYFASVLQTNVAKVKCYTYHGNRVFLHYSAHCNPYLISLTCILEMQPYTFWMYRYIISFVSRCSKYSWFLQMDRAIFPIPSCFIPTKQLQNCKVGIQRSRSHNTVHTICSIEVKISIYHAQYSIYPDIQYIDTT